MAVGRPQVVAHPLFVALDLGDVGGLHAHRIAVMAVLDQPVHQRLGLVEVLFGLTAILAGGILAEYIEGNQGISYFIVAVLLAGGLFFIIKKQGEASTRNTTYSGFFKGIFLNLVSIQVFLYWILAIAFLSTRQLLQYDLLSILIFIIGIWIGKMTVLLLYMNLSKKLLSGSRIISKNINRIIGIVLFGMAFFQALKI